MMKKDKKDKFLDAMGNTAEINIAEYESAVKAKRRKLTCIIAAIAALCLIITAIAVAIPLMTRKN